MIFTYTTSSGYILCIVVRLFPARSDFIFINSERRCLVNGQLLYAFSTLKVIGNDVELSYFRIAEA